MAQQNKSEPTNASAQQATKKQQAIQQTKPLIFTLILWMIFMFMAHIADYYWGISKHMIAFVVETTIFIGSSLGFSLADSISPHLQVAGFDMEVIFECTAYNFYLFVIALVLFARWTLKDKFINFAIFMLSVFLLNASRFIIMGYIGSKFPKVFHQIHDYVWTILFALLIAGLYLWRNKKYNI